MDEQERGHTGERGEQVDPGHPVGPEIDDTTNPTEASPSWDASESGAPNEAAPRAAAGREMLVQLQQMIDTLATQAAPVMREVAAKAAELAAIAGEKAGPLAHKAAGVTETVGQRVAARSKVMAADLRRPREASVAETQSSKETGTDDKSSDWSP